MKLCDTHAHIYFEQYINTFSDLIEDIKNNLEFVVSISCDMESTLKSLKLAKKYPKLIYSTIGYHPVDISLYNEIDYQKMLEIAKKEREYVIAFGEIGLDYHWMKNTKDEQKSMFLKQLKDAYNLNLPVIIHSREALDDTIKILKSTKNIGILHAYPGTYDECKEILDRFYIGIGGTLTFKNNLITKELVKKLPLDRIVIETDSPFLTPVPFRGKINNPIYVKYVAEEIAKIKEINLNEVIKVTTENAKKIFNI